MTRPWPVPASLVAELVPAEAALALEPHWRDLAARALEPNPFFGPARSLAAMRHLPEAGEERLALAWRGEGDTRRLVGLLPLVRPRGRFFNPFPIRRAPAHYGTLSTPLLDPDRPAETLAAMLRRLGDAGAAGVLLPFMSAEGPAAAALAAASAAAGLPIVRANLHRRALLRSPLPSRDYLRATLETRRRKELDRQRRRLAEEGRLVFALARSPDEVISALERFLELEAAGWKGRARTAMALDPGAAAFIRETVAAQGRAGAFRVATLAVDGRVIAAGLVELAGRRAFYLKIAHDEAYARFSPGLLLTAELTVHLLDDPEIDDADSLAVADHPMIERIWAERFAVESVLVATRPGGGASFRAAAGLEHRREEAWAAAKAGWLKLRAFRTATAKQTGNKRQPAAPA